MIGASKVVFPDVMLKLEWPMAACTQCGGELGIKSWSSISQQCSSCGHVETKTVIKYVQASVVSL